MTEAHHDVVIVDDDHCEAPVLSAPPMHSTAMQDDHAHGSNNMVLDDTESDEECDFQGALKVKTTPGKKGAGGKKTTPGNKGAGGKKLTSDQEKRLLPDDDSDGDFKVPTKKSRKTSAKGKGQMGIGSFFSKESTPTETPADHKGRSRHVALERHMHPSEGGITLSEGVREAHGGAGLCRLAQGLRVRASTDPMSSTGGAHGASDRPKRARAGVQRNSFAGMNWHSTRFKPGTSGNPATRFTAGNCARRFSLGGVFGEVGGSSVFESLRGLARDAGDVHVSSLSRALGRARQATQDADRVEFTVRARRFFWGRGWLNVSASI